MLENQLDRFDETLFQQVDKANICREFVCYKGLIITV